MKITIESTPQIEVVEPTEPDGTIPGRIWTGTTASGIKVKCFIPYVGVLDSEDLAEFEKELEQQPPPRMIRSDDGPRPDTAEALADQFPGMFKFGPEKLAALNTEQTVITSGLLWLAVHGAICLALRHPDFNGPTNDALLHFVRSLGQSLVAWDCLTPDELEVIERTEKYQRPEAPPPARIQ